MKLLQKLAHAVWDCKYHIVWCPKYRFRILKGEVAKSVVEIIQQLCEWKRDVKGFARERVARHVELFDKPSHGSVNG